MLGCMPTLDLSLLTEAERWRKRAEEMRTIGDTAIDPENRRQLLNAAEDYDRLAEQAEKVKTPDDPPPSR
jgi:hypothetical protein